MYDLTYISPAGQPFPLTEGQITIAGRGVEGLCSIVRDQTSSAVGVPGQIFEAQDVEPMRGTLELWITSVEGKSAQDLAGELRGALSTSKYGSLTMETNRGKLIARVRAAQVPDPPLSVNGEGDVAMRVQLISDAGTWGLPFSLTGAQVSVLNHGDVYFWPVISWSGGGGRLTLPSGAQVSLPAVSAPRHLHVDPSESCVVVDDDGVIDHAVWQQIQIIPEGVPPGAERVFRLPAGASLSGVLAFFDPWR